MRKRKRKKREREKKERKKLTRWNAAMQSKQIVFDYNGQSTAGRTIHSKLFDTRSKHQSLNHKSKFGSRFWTLSKPNVTGVE